MNHNREKSFSTFKKPLAMPTPPTRLVNPHAPTRICCQLCYALYYNKSIRFLAVAFVDTGVPTGKQPPIMYVTSSCSSNVRILVGPRKFRIFISC